MGIALILVSFVYIIFAVIMIAIASKGIKSKLYVLFFVIFFAVIPFHRMIFIKTLFFFYSKEPLEVIHETVEKPISVYWEDKVTPGFNKFDREGMVRHYLDGVHVKVLAMNGKDGKYYIYRATEKDYEKSNELLLEYEKAKSMYLIQKEISDNYLEELRKARKQENIIKIDKNKPVFVELRKRLKITEDLRNKYDVFKKNEDKKVLSKGQVLLSKTFLKQVNYKIEWAFVSESRFVNTEDKILYGDKISIVDLSAKKVIAYSKRYMAYAGLISKFSGQQPKFDYKLGRETLQHFDDEILFYKFLLGTASR